MMTSSVLLIGLLKLIFTSKACKSTDEILVMLSTKFQYINKIGWLLSVSGDLSEKIKLWCS